jgi:uncharacterized damage-inducible protein DinB
MPPSDHQLLEVLLDSWDRSNTILLNVLHAIPGGGLEARLMADSPSVAQLFAHIHYVRLVFIAEDAPGLELSCGILAGELPEAEWSDERDPVRLAQMLNASARAVRDAVRSKVEAGQHMDLHYDHPLLFIQHMLWHEGYHHGQIKLVLKSTGRPIADNIAGPVNVGRMDAQEWSKIVTMRTLALMLCAGIVSSALCQDGLPPVLPFYDWGACPYETCAYSEWTAHGSVTVYDTWKQERRPIAQLAKGDKATGTTGVVITFHPGLIRMDRDYPEQNLRRGDTLLTYAYRGEGFSAAWFKGKYYSDLDISFTKWPDGTGCGGEHCAATYMDLGTKSWWAEVKLSSGTMGWVEMETAQTPLSLFQ